MTTAFMLPWLRLDKPFGAAKGVTLLPLSTAISTLSVQEGAALRSAASTFYDTFPIESVIAGLRELKEEASELPSETIVERLRALHLPSALAPAIILTSDNSGSIRLVQNVLNALTFASIVENQRFNYVNSAAFSSFRLRIAGGSTGFLTDSTVRLYGRTLNTVDVTQRIDMRPRQVPDSPRIGANGEFLSALVDGSLKRRGISLARALENLRMATSDSQDITDPLKESLFALAAELIAEIPPQQRGKKRTAVINQRLHALLDPLFSRSGPTSSRRRRGRKAATIISVFWAVRRKRNSFWHPEADRRRAPRFSRQLLVTPLAIAINMTYAITIARLVELGALSKGSDMIADVYASTDWLAHLGPELQRNLVHPDDVRDDRKARAKAMVAWNEAAEQASNYGTFRAHERIVIGVSKAVARASRKKK